MISDDNIFEVDTRPTKAVVVSSLTRDVNISECIYDLIDNSIDAARDIIFSKPGYCDTDLFLPDSYDGFSVKLFLTGEKCRVVDNCGGIPSEQLKTLALRFGEISSHAMGIGVFGVGLNRALFKLGGYGRIVTETTSERSEVEIDTGEYLQSESWSLPARALAAKGCVGTEIEITKLSEDISRVFGDNAEIEKLRGEIGKIYGRFIEKGLAIYLNDKPVNSKLVYIRDDGPFERKYRFLKTNENVSIHIQFGQHKDHRFSAEPDYSRDGNNNLTSEYGWSIFCNDRAIVLSDRTWKTGWDTHFHTEFYGFVGIVDFNCKESSRLPWDTKKTNVDLNNHSYGSALEGMRSFAEKWRSYAGEAKAKKRKQEPLLPVPKNIPSAGDGAPGQDADVKSKSVSSSKSSGQKKDITKPTVKQDHNQYTTILPNDVNEINCHDKFLALVHEAKNLSLTNFSYSGLALTRILFETASIDFFIRHGHYSALKEYAIEKRKREGVNMTPAKIKNFWPKMEEIFHFMEDNSETWERDELVHLKHSATNMAKHSKILNGVMHNPKQPINLRTAFHIRDEILPILRYFIEG